MVVGGDNYQHFNSNDGFVLVALPFCLEGCLRISQ